MRRSGAVSDVCAEEVHSAEYAAHLLILGKHVCAGEWLVILDELLDLFHIRREIMHGFGSTSFGGHQPSAGMLQAQSSAQRGTCPRLLPWQRSLSACPQSIPSDRLVGIVKFKQAQPEWNVDGTGDIADGIGGSSQMPNPLVRHRMIPVPLWLSAGMRDNKARSYLKAQHVLACHFPVNQCRPQLINIRLLPPSQVQICM